MAHRENGVAPNLILLALVGVCPVPRRLSRLDISATPRPVEKCSEMGPVPSLWRCALGMVAPALATTVARSNVTI